MKILKYLLIGVAALVVALVGIGYALPSKGHVERSIEIAAPPATVYVILNSFRRFQDWSPWKKHDPAALVTYSGPDVGVGATMAWSGEQGGGSQEIIATKANESVDIKLVFDGFEGDDYVAHYTLQPTATGTLMTWSFDAEYRGVIGRYFGLIMDDMLGPDYEDGLNNLKALIEDLPTVDFSQLDVSVVETPSQTLAYISGTTSTDVAAITTAFSVAYSKVLAYLQAQNLKPAGARIGISRKWDEPAKVFEYDAGIPIENPPKDGEGEVKIGKTYAGKALKVRYQGSYKTMGPVYEALFTYAAINGYSQNGNLWEEYVSDPSTAAEADLITHIYMPVK